MAWATTSCSSRAIRVRSSATASWARMSRSATSTRSRAARWRAKRPTAHGPPKRTAKKAMSVKATGSPGSIAAAGIVATMSATPAISA